MLVFSDTGVGMDKSTVQQVFEPFFTTKGDQGTGLGLATVYGIIKQHNGNIWVYSEPGRGTTFKIYLPTADKHERSLPQETVEGVPGGSERIIFVDDEEALAMLGNNLLSKLGYEVSSFTNSSDALQAFREAPDNYDLIITDMTMPVMTGVELARKVKQVKPDIPIIICTGFSENLDKQRANEMGICAYLTKPVLQKDLAHTIRKALDSGS